MLHINGNISMSTAIQTHSGVYYHIAPFTWCYTRTGQFLPPCWSGPYKSTYAMNGRADEWVGAWGPLYPEKNRKPQVNKLLKTNCCVTPQNESDVARQSVAFPAIPTPC